MGIPLEQRFWPQMLFFFWSLWLQSKLCFDIISANDFTEIKIKNAKTVPTEVLSLKQSLTTLNVVTESRKQKVTLVTHETA